MTVHIAPCFAVAAGSRLMADAARGVEARDAERQGSPDTVEATQADGSVGALGVASPTARRLLDVVGTRLPRPPGLALPRPLWWLMRPGAGHAASTVLLGSFPAVLRRRLNVGWTPIHEAEYRAALTGLRVTSAVLPDRLTLFPIAYRARKTAARGASTW